MFNPRNISICVTGTLTISRAQITRFIREQGGRNDPDVRSTTRVVVVGMRPGATKLRQGISRGCVFITEQELYQVAGNIPPSARGYNYADLGMCLTGSGYDLRQFTNLRDFRSVFRQPTNAEGRLTDQYVPPASSTPEPPARIIPQRSTRTTQKFEI